MVWGMLLKTFSHNLYALSVLKGGLVLDFWSSSGQNFSWCHLTRGGVESEQLKNLIELLTPIVLTSNPDMYTWDYDPSGTFLVNSARRHIDSYTLSDRGVVTPQNKHAPIKVSIFCGDCY